MEVKAGLPFAGFHLFSDLAFHQVAFQRADVMDVQAAIEVVGFVHESAREQVFSCVLEEFTSHVLSTHGDTLWARRLL